MDQPIPHWRQEAGGRGKGQTRPQGPHPYQTASRLPVSNQRLPEILDGRHPRGLRLEASPPEQTQGAPDQSAEAEAGPAEGRRRPSSSWLPELLGRGRHKMQAQPSPRFCGEPENWNCTPRRARSIQSSREPEQCRWESTHHERGKPVWPEHGEGSPHTAMSVCSAPPSPQQD